MVRKITKHHNPDQLTADLERYRNRALELGATDASVISAEAVIVDERVRAKCLWPRCRIAGTCANCPPLVPPVEFVRQVVGRYQAALFARFQVPPEVMAGPDVVHNRTFAASHRRMGEIVSRIEAEAFYDGHYLALAFGSGSCKTNLCPDTACSALTPGQPCRHPLKSRLSMEAASLDAFAMAAEVGWEMYPIGGSVEACDIPSGSSLGVVLID